MRSGATPEKRPLTQLGPAGISLAVLGDIGRACPDRVQAGHHRAVVAQYLTVHRRGQPFDEAHLEHPKMPLVPLIDGWETVVEMEAALGIPPGNLAATLDRYNAYAARGADPDFHKQPEFLAAQDNGPWGAFDMSLGKAMYAGFTLGAPRCLAVP